jgi:lysosomal acid lipase/cholesteryl ester hydrolase
MYDDDVYQPMSVTSSSKYSKVAKYPTRNIKTPVVLVYGGSDSLVDIKSMLKELPRQTVATEIPHYEHLDFLWARDVDTQVFQHVFDALNSFTDAEHTEEEYDRYHFVRHESLVGSAYTLSHPHRGSESDASIVASSSGEEARTLQHRAREQRVQIASDKEPAKRIEDPQPVEKLKGVGVRRGSGPMGNPTNGESADSALRDE